MIFTRMSKYGLKILTEYLEDLIFFKGINIVFSFSITSQM